MDKMFPKEVFDLVEEKRQSQKEIFDLKEGIKSIQLRLSDLPHINDRDHACIPCQLIDQCGDLLKGGA